MQVRMQVKPKILFQSVPFEFFVVKSTELNRKTLVFNDRVILASAVLSLALQTDDRPSDDAFMTMKFGISN